MAYQNFRSQAYYLACIDAARGSKKEPAYFEHRSSWELYDQTYTDRRLNHYGQKYLLLSLRRNAFSIWQFESGVEKPHFDIFEIGCAAGKAERELLSEEELSRLGDEKLSAYELGLSKGTLLTCYPADFPTFLEQAPQHPFEC